MLAEFQQALADLTASPGLKTMLDLPVPTCFATV